MSSFQALRDASRVTPERNPSAPATNPEETPYSQTKVSIQLKHSVETDGKERPANFENAQKVQDRIHRDISKAAMKIMSLVGALFPDGILGISTGEIDELVQNVLLRQGNEWVLWPRAVESLSEPAMADFVNLIGIIAKVQTFNDKDPRHCSSMFHNKGVPDKKWRTRYKPDDIIIDGEGCESVTWALIKMIIEMKFRDLKEGIEQGARYAQSIFDAQPGRHFVPVIVVAGQKATLLLFDRSGSLHSEEIDVQEDVHTFLRLILGILFADEEHLGYDSSLQKRSGEDGLFIETGGVTYKVECIYHEHGIKGRGTVCYRGVSLVDSSVVVIKDTWVDVSRKESEVKILKKLNKEPAEKLSTPDGVRVIPEFVSSENVKRRRPGIEPGSWIFVDASTEMFREEMVERDLLGKAKWAWSTTEDKNKTKIEIRTLVRIVTKPFGQKLETFTSKKVLMRAFSDIIYAIRILLDLGYVHRDISFRNILLYQHDGTLRGLLIDYDYAVSINRAKSEAIAERTGTIPFMAIDRMKKKPEFHHNFFHDLESLFYVLCWLCTLYEGPRSRKRQFSTKGLMYLDCMIAGWNGDTVGDKKNFETLYTHKGYSVSEMGFPTILRQFATYFEGLRIRMWDFQALLFNPLFRDDRKEQYEAKQSELNSIYESEDPEIPVEEKERVEREYADLPLPYRHPDIVFRSLLAVADRAVNELPEEGMPPNAQEAATEASYEDEKEGQEIPLRRMRDYNSDGDAVIAAAQDDFTYGDVSSEQVGSPSDAPLSQPFFSESKGLLASSSSRMSQKRKSGEASATSSSKRSKSESLQTPRDSTSELIDEPIAEDDADPTNVQPTNVQLSTAQRKKGKFKLPKGPVRAKEPDVFDEQPRAGRSSSIIKGNVEDMDI